MTTKVDNTWPLTVVHPPAKNVLPQDLTARHLGKHQQETVTPEKVLERRPNVRWEKGSIVDLYV